jgi:uncharacterized membrane protein YgdD (TMEM256/DUF423 family)
MQRFLLLACTINGFLAVLLGAFGAHGLQTRLASLPDAARRLGWWQTASNYQLAHALALGLVACWWTTQAPSPWLRVAGIAMLVGITFFSGSLYLMTLTGLTTLGAITPLGGLGFLVGWAALAVAAFRS